MIYNSCFKENSLSNPPLISFIGEKVFGPPALFVKPQIYITIYQKFYVVRLTYFTYH